MHGSPTALQRPLSGARPARAGSRGPRRWSSLAVGALLAASGLLLAPAAPATAAARPALVEAFPSDALTVPDRSQLTGRRVALPLPDCQAQPTQCATTRLLNELDGFDLDPRIALRFDAPVDPAAVARSVLVERIGRGPGVVRTGVDRVVYDAATHTLYAHPVEQLAPGTRYRIRVLARPTRPSRSTTFTTLSATDGLLDMRRQLDSGLAHRLAGIDDERGLRVEHVAPAAGTTVAYARDLGGADLAAPQVALPQALPGAASYVFGSFLAPSWLTEQSLIPQTATAGPGPVVQDADRLPFVLIVPTGAPPQGGWPVTVFGHGFTSSPAAVFAAATQNAARGIATIATTVVGHGSGPRSEWVVTTDGATTRVPAYGRGLDQNGDGAIGSTEGSSTPGNPGPLGAVNSRDGLRQTVADIMTLVREVGRGVDLDPDDADLSPDLRQTDVGYFGQSFGGIYGTMLGGVDPLVPDLVLNVPGGPIVDIGRLSPVFRPLTAVGLGGAQPSLLNGGPAGFTESLPLRGEAPVTSPAAGALAIQDYFADARWITRPGSPETFAPLLRERPVDSEPKDVIVQVAHGDQTVPNPTSHTLIGAGDLWDRTSLYRNDRTPLAGVNPHAFLTSPLFVQAFVPGQQQIAEFFASGGDTVVDPDGAGPVWEVPIVDPQVLTRLNVAPPPAGPAV